MKKIRSLALAGLFVLFATRSSADTITENFSADPLQNGWRIFGDTNLFQWNSTNQNLAVTWDSSQPNSYFYHPLGTILAMDDDFRIEFDLQLSNVEASGSFQLAVGLLNFTDATSANFSRPEGDTPNLFEFDYFPDGGYGSSIDATLADANVTATNDNDFYFAYEDSPLDNGVTYHIVLTHAAGSPAISGEVLTNGQIDTSLPNVYTGPITDFRLDTLSISSYSDALDPYGPQSILAHGTVDNFVVTLPPPPIQNLNGAFSNGTWQIQFDGRTNWLYTLQRTVDFQTWTNISLATSGDSGTLFLSDTNAPVANAFYRVSAARP
ncbi:MAG: hypothetical protein ACREFE_01150 [Limisphaerales bacterium]